MSSKYYFQPSAALRPKRDPLHTLAECAEAVGAPVQALTSAMRRDPDAPKPRIRAGANVCVNRRGYYNKAAVVAWWKGRSGA